MSQARQWPQRLLAIASKVSSIRSRIVLLAIVAMAPLLADRVRLMETTRTERIASAGKHALELAYIGVDKQNDVIAAARAVLQTIGHTLDRMPAESRDCNRLLNDTASDISWARTIFVSDAKGRALCSSNPQLVGTAVSDRLYFHDAIKNGGFALSGPLYSHTATNPEVAIAYGKRNPRGTVDTVIVAALDTRQIGQLAPLVAGYPNALALLVDPGGVVLAGYPNPNSWAGRDLANSSLIREVGQRATGTAVADIDGAPRIWGFLPITGTQGHLLVGLDERAVLTRVDRDMWLAYVQLSLAVLLVFLGAWLFGEHAILRPLRLLARQAERIGRGELSARTAGAEWASEFRPLTHALDSMAERLAERERDLRSEREHFRELASVDGLTGLSNRRSFDNLLAAEWSRAALTRSPIALLMIDVDHFKRYNDRYGHLDGDVCLRAIASLLLALAADHRCAARYGGEEFSLLLPGAESAAAFEMAETIRRTIAGLRMPHADAPGGVVTVSIGSASLVPSRDADVADLIEAADAALYASKQRRNTATAHKPVKLVLAKVS